MEGSKLAAAILGEVRRAVVGKDEVVERVLMAILSEGHVLLDDVPGVGKTTLAVACSRVMGMDYHRVQFTPDVVPSDIVGFSVYNKETGSFDYKPGVVMTNLLLADEINRTSSKTQSALLEVMEEGQVTVDGVTHGLPKPFVVIATQNPAGASGTQLLPDSQMDRFMVRLSIGYPAPADEMAMVRRRQGGALLEGVRPVLELNGLLALRAQAGQVYVSDEVLDYIVRLVGATRSHPMILQGASPRATLALTAMAKAAALVRGRDYVLPEDVSLVFGDVVPHRLLLSPRAEADRSFDPASELLERVPAPRIS